MSLDVYLVGEGSRPTHTGIFIRDDGRKREITREEWDKAFPGREPVVVVVDDGGDDGTLFSANITHNLGHMAHLAGLYQPLWRPDEEGIATARQLIEPLRVGLERLKASPDEFKVHNPPNGWGTYEGLVRFVEDYLVACIAYPEATVRVSR